MLLASILIPILAGAAAFLIRPDGPRRVILVTTAAIHALFTAGFWLSAPRPALGGWIALDTPGLLFLSVTSLLFLAAAVFAVGYLAHEERGRREDFEEGVLFANAPEAVFTGCLLLFLATMSLVCASRHLGLLWVAVEATTLASAPLIYFHRHHRSLEATWKYLIVCSVGIALALLGNFFLAVAAREPGGGASAMLLEDLIAGAGRMHVPWVEAAFLFLVVGYGTKMGLAPLHTWLPDAHSESPSVVSALMSGALLNCAFLGIVRSYQVCVAAGLGAFAGEVLVAFGLLSMGLAAVFILSQADYKRMLAYSSVEHMGILALGVGVGGAATAGAMLHVVNHSLSKGMLFLLAGNILSVYRSKSTSDVKGVLHVLPVTGVLWVAGFLAITGFPPFAPFLSELTILRGALDQRMHAVAIAYLALLAVIFVGMAQAVLGMAQGSPPAGASPRRERLLAVAPPAALALIVLILGLYVPPALLEATRAAALALGGP